MRKILDVALEGQHFGPVGDANISLEEEQIMLDEAANDNAEAEQDLGEAERIIEVSDALEDLAVVADGIEEATPAEAQLIETAGQMAVAGTDVAPEEIVPAMESYIGRKIATEGIRETAKAIWESIRKFLKKIWEKIESFFYKIFGTIPALRRRLKTLEKRAQDSASKTLKDEKKFSLSTGVAALAVDGKAPKNAAEVRSGLKDLRSATDDVYGEWMEIIGSNAEKAADIIGDFDGDNGEAQVGKLIKALDDAKKPNGLRGSDNSRFPGFQTYMGPALPGGHSLCLKRPKAGGAEGAGSLGMLDRLRRSGLELVPTSAKTKEVKSVEFQAMSSADVSNLVGDMEHILDKLEEFQRGKRSKDLKKHRDSMESASKKAEAAYSKRKGSDEAGERASLPYYRALLNFNTAYARWAQQPAMPMVSHCLTTIRAVMNVCDKSLSLHS